MQSEATAQTERSNWFSLKSFGAGALVMLVAAGVFCALQQKYFPDVSALHVAHVYYDMTTGKLVSDAIVRDEYFGRGFAEYHIDAPTASHDIVLSVPEGTVVFDQKSSEDGRFVYGSLLTITEPYTWSLPYGFKELQTGGNGFNTTTSLVFGYDTVNRSIVFAQMVPDYNRINAISPGGELVALANYPCYACDGGPVRYLIIDATGKVRVPKDLGTQYAVTFTGPRTYTVTAGTTEGCDAMGCFNPAEISKEQEL